MSEPGLIPKLYRQHRAELRAEMEDDDGQLFIDVVFGIGLLLGASWPGAAAAISVIAEDRFKDRPLPWTGLNKEPD